MAIPATTIDSGAWGENVSMRNVGMGMPPWRRQGFGLTMDRCDC